LNRNATLVPKAEPTANPNPATIASYFHATTPDATALASPTTGPRNGEHAIRHARTAGRGRLDEQARELSHHAYAQLATDHPAGIAGALCARSEAHTIRLALLYALADGERKIKTERLQAACALWDYTARSATWALKAPQATRSPDRSTPPYNITRQG
jgi:hypothetical protein